MAAGNYTTTLPDGTTVTYNQYGALVNQTPPPPKPAQQPSAPINGLQGAGPSQPAPPTQTSGGPQYPQAFTMQPGQTFATTSGHTESAPGGQSISSPAYEAQQQAQLQASLQQQQSQLEASLSSKAMQDRLKMVQGLDSSTASAPHVGFGGSPFANEEGARAAAFGRAKDLAGKNALAGLMSVNDTVADRGLMGSMGRGFESGLLGQVIGGAQGQIADFGREQLIQDLNRAAQIADTTYQGNITQRGQDLDRQRVLLGLIAGGGLY